MGSAAGPAVASVVTSTGNAVSTTIDQNQPEVTGVLLQSVIRHYAPGMAITPHRAAVIAGSDPGRFIRLLGNAQAPAAAEAPSEAKHDQEADVAPSEQKGEDEEKNA